MLSDPKRLRTARSYGYLVSWKHRLRADSEPAAAALVEELLEDEQNVAALRAALGRPEATLEELAEWLVSGFVAGAFNVLRTGVEPPVLDAPPETNLTDLLPPPEPQRDLDSLTFEVVDQAGEGVPVRFEVHAPSGDPAGSLPAGERRFVGELEHDAYVEVELEAITLPLLPETEVDPTTDATDPEPSPLGPGGTQPEPPSPPAPLGPGGEEPKPDEAFPLLRTAPTPCPVEGALALPSADAPTHFIPVVLTAARHARELDAAEIVVVSLGGSPHADTRIRAIKAVFADDLDGWVKVATEGGSLGEVIRYLAHLSVRRGWDVQLGDSEGAAIRSFQSEYNLRFDRPILVDGVCGTQTLGAVFNVLRDERDRWAPVFGLSNEDLVTQPVRFLPGSDIPQNSARYPSNGGLDVWVFRPATLPASFDLSVLYDNPRAEVERAEVPWCFERDDLVIRLQGEFPSDFDEYRSVRVERSDGSWFEEKPLSSDVSQNVVFRSVDTRGRFTVSLVNVDGTRHILAADQPFATFLDDREGNE